MKLERVSFKYQKETIGGFLYTPDGAGPFPAVILVHGFAGGVHQAKLKSQCEQLAKKGFMAFMFDFYDIPNQISTVRREFTSVSLQLKILRSAVDYICGLSVVDVNKIGLAGHSLGGMTALLYCVADSRIKALVLESPVSDFGNTPAFDADKVQWKKKGHHIFARSFGEMKIYWDFMKDGLKYDVYTFARKVKCPVLVTHGDTDSVVPLDHSKKLVKHLKVSDQLIIVPGAGHEYKEGNSLAMVTSKLIEFMKNKL